MKGFPVNPCLHTQIGLWLITLQRAFSPHAPSQGLMHFCELQDKSGGHSELTTHSGRQFGGEPLNEGKQEHTACPFISLHWLLAPQGVGLQGFVSNTWAENKAKYFQILMILKLYFLNFIFTKEPLSQKIYEEYKKMVLTFLHNSTISERVSGISRLTNACWHMIVN